MSTTTKTSRSRRARFYRDPAWGASPLTGREDWPSVTTILRASAKPQLVEWAARVEREACQGAAIEWVLDLVHDDDALDAVRQASEASLAAQFEARVGRVKTHRRRSQQALELGAIAHELIRQAMLDQIGVPHEPRPASVPAEAELVVMAWDDYCRSERVRPIVAEQTVRHPTLGYAGTIDLVAQTRQGPRLFDFKTSAAVYAEYRLQVWAYLAAWQAEGRQPPLDTGVVICLPKTLDAVQAQPTTGEVTLGDARLRRAWRALLAYWPFWHAEDEASYAAWLAKQQATP